MLQNTLLSNLSMNLGRMDKLQNQLSSGRKYAHISDDPSALIYGQAARNKLARLDHYMGTVEMAQSWLTQAEAGVMELNKVVGAVYEELVSAGSVKSDPDKKNLGMVIEQLRDHYVDTLNSSFGDRFVFGAYNTPGDHAFQHDPSVKPFTLVKIENADGEWTHRLHFNGFDVSMFDGMPAELLNTDLSGLTAAEITTRFGTQIDSFVDDYNNKNAAFLQPTAALPGSPPLPPQLTSADFVDALMTLHHLKNDVIEFDVGPGVSMPVTQNGIDVIFAVTRNNGEAIVRNTFDLIDEVFLAVNGNDRMNPPPPPADNPYLPKDTDELTVLIKLVQDSQNHLLTRTAELGGRQRRLELMEARYAQDNLNYEKMRSDAEDADMAEVIMFLKMSETVYQAALSAGARVIQPTLMDFLR